jgi:hypothetical protein
MPLRSRATLLLCAVVMLIVVGTIYTAPAPLPKKGREEMLFQRLHKMLHTHGYRLHELRPGPKPEEWVLVVSSLEPAGSRKWGLYTTQAIPAKVLADAEVVKLVVELAEIDVVESNLPKCCGSKPISKRGLELLK